MTQIVIPGATVYPRSVVEHAGSRYLLCRVDATGEKRLAVSGDITGFAGQDIGQGTLLCPCSAEHAVALRARLPWLNPVALGRQTSFGFGDRMGSATPGHIQAMRSTGAEATIGPIYAQQSVRENTRTGRTPQLVIDDAVWGMFQEGWRAPWGADADHVKEIADLAPFVTAGYTFYTIDPSDYVDNAAQADSPEVLRDKVARLPWDQLGTTYEALRQRYCEVPFALDGLTLQFGENILLRALAKYGRAIAHTASIAAALTAGMQGQRYDLEISVDETDTPTSVYEHFLIANELRAREIPVASVAPRFVGKFQKGVDYMGDIALFEAELAKHAAIMQHFDSYKLSIHTGSDKFSIYPIIARHAHGHVHVKTAGTSYLEALRLVAEQAPTLFRSMLDHAREHFEHDRKTYFLDAQLGKVPAGGAVADADLPDLLNQFDSRQVLHVVFGSILDSYGDALRAFIAAHEDDYRAGLEQHFTRHLSPFVQPSA
ncbi:MAG TPA: tagaturonate epimerase family protein [Roseiflexaceae bacterium]|nr:tagaturonate epimerase family protein [Roseiflexaceae bacterium]